MRRAEIKKAKSARGAVFGAAIAVLAALAGDLVAADAGRGRAAPAWSVQGELLTRAESWSWFGDAESSYEYAFARLRVSARYRFRDWEAVLQPQFVAFTGLPDDSFRAAPLGPSGMGALYYQHNGTTSPESAGLREAFVRWNAPDGVWRVQLGRFAYASGVEHLAAADGAKFNKLKQLRLADRLVSTFDWSAFGRSFDGAQVRYTAPQGPVATAAWMMPTEGGWDRDFNRPLPEVRIAAATLTLPKDTVVPGGELAFFAYHYRDTRHTAQRIDNSGQPAARADLDLLTVGAHLVGLRALGPGQWDYLAWGAVQTGDWYEQSHRAGIAALETGYQWTALPAKPWLRLGGHFATGDDDPADGRHGTFFQLAPGTRKYQLFPYYNFQNTQGAFVQLLLAPTKRLSVRLDLAANRLTEAADRWYMGSGPTQDDGVFGYVARPTGGSRDLGREAAVTLAYQATKTFRLELFYARAWGSRVIEAVYGDADGGFGSCELTCQF